MAKFALDTTRPVRLFPCPACGKKRLKLYVNQETIEYLDYTVGRCNREINCGYHYTPRQYFADTPNVALNRVQVKPELSKSNPGNVSYIDESIVVKSLARADHNHFLEFIELTFGPDIRKTVQQNFKIGSSKLWRGATVFWQIDNTSKIRSGKIMLYNRVTGKRIKEPFDHITWAHSVLIKKGAIESSFNLNQCLFGLHQLLTSNVKTIGVVESEKTAILASIMLPDLTWMATGGKSNLSEDKLLPIKRFPIVLYPDYGGFDSWNAKALELKSKGFKISTSSVVKQFSIGNPVEKDYDIADFLLEIKSKKSIDEYAPDGTLIDAEKGYPVSWDIKISTLLDRMISRNPLLKELITRLDLVEINSINRL